MIGRFCSVACIVALLGVLGCGSGAPTAPPVVKVKGTLVHEGKPLADANVSFHPAASTVVGSALTDAEGKFELSTVPGENTVTVTLAGAGSGASVMSPDAIMSGG
ncbi:MAG: carboxypeptidase-like regulatory domain-containing protein, partial [Planctomycetota bacterium]